MLVHAISARTRRNNNGDWASAAEKQKWKEHIEWAFMQFLQFVFFVIKKNIY